MNVRPARIEDLPQLYRIAQSRCHDYDQWCPEPEFEVTVADDNGTVVAFLLTRPARSNLILCDVFECEYVDGKPTKRGLRGVSLLEAWLRDTLKQRKQQAFSIVGLDNLPHMQALERRGWTKRANIYGSNYTSG